MLDTGWTTGPPEPRSGRSAPVLGAVVLAVIVGLSAAIILTSPPPASPEATRRPPAVSGRPTATGTPVGPRSTATTPPVAAGGQVVVLGAAPVNWDPALIGDAGSAGILAQVDESLTAIDAQSKVQPALAASWSVDDGGRQITFTMRPGATFSDGSPITAADVRRSWLRVLDPKHPSPLAGLLSDIVGANAYLAGTGSADAVGIDASGAQVVVHFRRAAAYFVSAAASPTLSVVPDSLPGSAALGPLPANLVVSGAYMPQSETDTQIVMKANPRYWAGSPAIGTVIVTTSSGGASPIDTFQAGQVDYAPIFRDDAKWIRYDRTLGPQLRRSASLSVAYYGFTTTKPPFDNVDVRRAFALAVNWDRLVTLDDPQATPATSLVPIGIAGRGTQDFSPPFDVTGAKAALAKAGYPGGQGFPVVTLVSGGGAYEEAVAAQLEQVLGITVNVEIMAFLDYSDRLSSDPPAFWTLDWIADYPHPQDFLGLLLESGSSSNTGKWSNPVFDAAIESAAATEDPTAQEQAYSAAQAIVQDQVPVIPLRYGDDWALSRDGLLGAQETGVGFIRFASLAWAGK
jgi:ABC-type transport system substrate-binding protein